MHATSSSSKSTTTYKSYRRSRISKSQTFNNPFFGTNFKAQIKVKRATHQLPFKICKPSKEYFNQTQTLSPSSLSKLKRKAKSTKKLNKKSILSFNSTNDITFQAQKQITTKGQEIWRESCKKENEFLAEEKPKIWKKLKNRSMNSYLGDRWEKVETDVPQDRGIENKLKPEFVKVKHTCGNSGFIYKRAQEFENTL